MATTMASAGRPLAATGVSEEDKRQIFDSIHRLSDWLERNDYRGYDTFDGLSARFVRPLTFENKFLRIVLQQGVRRFPVNLRPLLGIDRGHSSKGMGFLARGFLRLHQSTGDPKWAEKSEYCLRWLMDHRSPGYSGACWGNHFDYQSRVGFIPKGMPTVVWTSLIGHAFLDAYDHFRKNEYLEVADSICEHLIRDIRTHQDGDALCLDYTPGGLGWVHNANTLSGCFLGRTYSHTKNESYLALAQKTMQYTAQHQRADGSWYYAEKADAHWVDNFH